MHDQSYQNPNDQSYSSRSGWPEWSSRCLRYPMPRMTINDDQLSVTHCHDSARRWLRKTIYDSDDDLGQEKLLNIQMMMIPTIVPYPTSGTGTSNARFWVWVHILVNLVAMAFLFTMNLYLPWVLNFNLSQARLLKETACNYVFSVLVHGIPSISAWISIHQNSQKFFCAKTSIGH